MRKKVLLICAMLAALTLAATLRPVYAPYIERWDWVTPVFEGTDDYFGTSVIAYKAGTTATLMVKLFNDLSSKAPFKVKVHMSWATENVTSTEKEIQPGQWYTFQVAISIPDTTVASNLVLHSFRIYVEYVVSSVVYWITPIPSGSNFAVYSADQADYQNLKKEYDSWRDSYAPGGLMAFFGMTAKAREMWTKAAVESYLGRESYRIASFSDAKTHYQTALNQTKEAISTDVDKSASFEDALVGLVDAGKNFLSMQGYAYIIFSIGFLFMGIGAMIYLIRRSRPPATA